MEIKALHPTKALSTLLKINPEAAKLIYAGLGVLAAGVIIGTWVKYGGDTVFRYGLYAVGLGVLMGVVLQFSGILSRIMAWFLVFVFMIWGSCIFAQILTNNVLSPPLAKASCLINPFAEQCAMAAAAKSAPQIDPSDVSPTPGIFPEIAISPNPETGMSPHMPTAPSEEPVVISAPPDPRNEIYLHFYQPYERDLLVSLADGLVNSGWNVQGADKGGEKIEVAEDYREVRFFFSEDAPLAARLALEIGDRFPEFDPVDLRDMSATRWAAKSKPGRMEVYLGK